jgi:hypothetical protein
VIVDTTKESSGRIFADEFKNEVASTRVLIDEVVHIVDEACDKDERAVSGLILEARPRDDGQIILHRPLKAVLDLAEFLEFHRKLALPDLLVRELLEVRRKADFRSQPDHPFRGIVLIPLDRVSEVHGELMVEIVIAFAESGEGGDHVVTRGMLVVKRSIAEPVSKGIDAKGRLSKDEYNRDRSPLATLLAVQKTGERHQHRSSHPSSLPNRDQRQV